MKIEEFKKLYHDEIVPHIERTFNPLMHGPPTKKHWAELVKIHKNCIKESTKGDWDDTNFIFDTIAIFIGYLIDGYASIDDRNNWTETDGHWSAQCWDEEIKPLCEEIMYSKGLAYSGEDDKFNNFKRLAEETEVDIRQVWYVYFVKHLYSLESFLRNEYHDSEKIHGRILDLINYLMLYYGILKEGNNVFSPLRSENDFIFRGNFI